MELKKGDPCFCEGVYLNPIEATRMKKSVLKQINADLRKENTNLKSDIKNVTEHLEDCNKLRVKQVEALREANAKLKADALNQYKTDMAYTKNLAKIVNGLCDVIDAKDAKFAKSVREGIVKLKLRNKLLNIFNVVVED